jgi:hypothetical protein
MSQLPRQPATPRTFDQYGNELDEVVVTAKRIKPPVQVDDLPEVTVTARRFTWESLLRPPNLYYVIGAAVVALFVTQPKSRRRRR